MSSLIKITLFLFSLKLMAIGPHVHGIVGIDLAVENKQLLVMLKTPAHSILGFEYKAKTKAEKELLLKAQKSWKNAELFLKEKAFKNCKIKDSQWKQVFEGDNHSNIEAELMLDCPHELKGKSFQITLHEKYKNVEKVHLQLIKTDGKIFSKKYTKVFQVKL